MFSLLSVTLVGTEVRVCIEIKHQTNHSQSFHVTMSLVTCHSRRSSPSKVRCNDGSTTYMYLAQCELVVRMTDEDEQLCELPVDV